MNIPMIKVPKFTMTLPVSGDVIEFRPFVVKEEKILILANETDDINESLRAVADVIEQCTFDRMKIENYCLADMQYAFLEIRGKSIGTELSLMMVCGECGAKHPKTFFHKDFQVVKQNVDKVINIDGEIKVELQYPGLQHYAMMFDKDTEESTFESVYNMIVSCIVKIYDNEEVFINDTTKHNQVRDFVDNLTPEQFEKFEQFFLAMPIMIKREEFTCSECNAPNVLIVDTLKSFFS